ncbi:MAG TPA: hypothetical protein EYO33_32280 [Phycisphaerales bacterium]|nr:hypothetical protein [Phycisphaerales bacterium]
MRCKRSGGLLAEVLLALGLLVMTLVVVAAVFPFSHKADRKAWQKMTAQRLVLSQVEAIRGAPFESVVDSSRSVKVDNTDYLIRVKVTPESATPVKVKSIRCEAVFPSGRWSLETRVARIQRRL